jgi:calcium permeable stress-gated cation channel
LFEPRQFTRAHRSPAPFYGGAGLFSWAIAAYKISDEELLKSVGLDTFMFLRFLRIGARMTFFGTILSLILIPVYATGEGRGVETESFNMLTLARVESGSDRLWATLLCEWFFIAFILRSFWCEWELYAKHRYHFLAHGDVDTPDEFRYACRVEHLPRRLQSNRTLRTYFERLFPDQVQQVSMCLSTTKLDKLVADRHAKVVALEKAVAFTHAKPHKPAPTMKDGVKLGCCGGTKVDSIPFLQGEIDRLNGEIDTERNILYMLVDADEIVKVEEAIKVEQNEVKQVDESDFSPIEMGLSEGGGVVVGKEDHQTTTADDADVEEEDSTVDGQTSATAFVTFTNLRSKQAAVQVEISGKKDEVDIFPAPEPAGIIWSNVTVSLSHQRLAELIASCLWITGVIFWAVPVSFVVSIANLNGILQAFGLDQADPNTFWYGLVTGLLPVIALQVLMILLYMAIVACATSFIRYKSMPEVDAYTFYWHQLFQFANLWLILIGGSAFNQIDSIIEDPTSISKVIAAAMPSASIFFVNMILVGTFGSFGLQLSLLPTYGVTLIMNMIQPEAQRTQRMLDDARKPPSLTWGKQIPGMVFVFLVAIMYFPIVPIMEVFALFYFVGHYLVFKHQCLHVYAQEFEGGGITTWGSLFSFLMAALYMSELVFIAFMGLKEGTIQGALGFVTFAVTIFVHRLLHRNIRQPLENLSMEAAAEVDIKEGIRPVDKEPTGNFESAIEKQVYGQPSLKKSLDQRAPLPYRRDAVDEMEK